MIDYAWDHAVISDRVYQDVKSSCNFSEETSTDACSAALNDYFAVYDIIDMYSLYSPVCVDSTGTSSKKRHFVSGVAPKLASRHVKIIRNLKFSKQNKRSICKFDFV